MLLGGFLVEVLLCVVLVCVDGCYVWWIDVLGVMFVGLLSLVLWLVIDLFGGVWFVKVKCCVNDVC